jgi:hypothetical protein
MGDAKPTPTADSASYRDRKKGKRAADDKGLRSKAKDVPDFDGQQDVEKGLPVTRVSDNTSPASIANAAPDHNVKVATTATDSNSPLTWFFLLLLFLGILASVVGYVGCFSIIQNAESSAAPVSWLCLEIGLSLIRMFLWGLNPDYDDAPPLEFELKLDCDAPLPTCNKYHDCIMEEKMLPLTRAGYFLKSITSFAGLVERFDNPDLTFYYTLTRKRVPDTNVQDSDERRRPSERVLYITIFDHKERTTRIYARDIKGDHFIQPNPMLQS